MFYLINKYIKAIAGCKQDGDRTEMSIGTYCIKGSFILSGQVLSAVFSTGLLCTLALPAHAAGSIDTLARIRESQTIIVGNRDSARPFSFLDGNHQPAGYSIELCQHVIAVLRKDLNLPNLKVKYVTVSGAERIPKLQSGAIDMECGTTTNTKARQSQVDFSYTMFVAGMKILSRTADAIAGADTLNNKTIAVSRGTTSEKLFSEMRDEGGTKMQLKVFPNNAAAFEALSAGKVDAFPQDDVLLMGMINARPDRKKFVLSEDYLSVEPYAIMVRKGDKGFLDELDRALASVYKTGEVEEIYNHWFNTDMMKVPMSSLLKEVLSRPAKDTGFAKVLGYSL